MDAPHSLSLKQCISQPRLLVQNFRSVAVGLVMHGIGMAVNYLDAKFINNPKTLHKSKDAPTSRELIALEAERLFKPLGQAKVTKWDLKKEIVEITFVKKLLRRYPFLPRSRREYSLCFTGKGTFVSCAQNMAARGTDEERARLLREVIHKYSPERMELVITPAPKAKGMDI